MQLYVTPLLLLLKVSLGTSTGAAITPDCGVEMRRDKKLWGGGEKIKTKKQFEEIL